MMEPALPLDSGREGPSMLVDEGLVECKGPTRVPGLIGLQIISSVGVAGSDTKR